MSFLMSPVMTHPMILNITNDITINYIIDDLKGDMKMKHIIKSEKPIEIIKESKIKKANTYSYKTIIPKEVMEVFPQLKENGKIIYHIQQTGFKEYQCDITLKAKGLKIQDVQESESEDDKESASNNIEDDTQKPVEKKTIQNKETIDAGFKTKYDDVSDCLTYPIENMDTHCIRINTTMKYPRLEIVRKKTGKALQQFIGISKNSDDEIKWIIQVLSENLSLCESEDDFKNEINAIKEILKGEQG